MVVVDDVGLITCERIVVGQSDERDGEECRVEGRRVSRQQQHADDTWMTCARHLEPMSRATLK